jgi:hypothetical protein
MCDSGHSHLSNSCPAATGLAGCWLQHHGWFACGWGCAPAGESGVTHVVFPFGPGGDPDDGKEYTTVVAIK